MTTMIIKIVDKNKPVEAAKAIGELSKAGYAVSYSEEVEFLGVDANQHSGDEQSYSACYVIVGKKMAQKDG